MHRFFRWFALFNALPVFLVAQEPALPAKEIFAKRPTGDLALEIYQSDDSDSLRAAVICLHGGGWKKGEPQHIAAFARELAGEGFVTIAPAYRLSDVAPFPAQIDDINAAIRWVRENANRYQIDPEKIGIIGSSAGGHLALLSATRPAPEIERPNAAIGLGA
ncbi:MAG: alpha/beta hydrolase, partial [Verrucomicrobiota bacterium]